MPHDESHMIAVIVVTSIMSLIFSLARNPAKKDHARGVTIIEYPYFIRLFALANFGISVALLIIISLAPLKNPTDRYYIMPMFIIGGLASIALYLYSKTRVELGATGIWSWTPWRGEQSCKWDDIDEVYYSTIWQHFTITMASGQKIRIHSMFLRGIKEMIMIFEENISPDIMEQSNFDKARKRFGGRRTVQRTKKRKEAVR